MCSPADAPTAPPEITARSPDQRAVQLDVDSGLLTDLVAANHILFQQGVVDGFGHVSARHPQRPDRFLLSRSKAPATVEPADIMEFTLDGDPVDDSGRTPYLERFIHGEIYRARADIQSVVHSHSPSIIPFGVVSTVPLRPIFHMTGFIGDAAPVFEIREAGGPETDMLVRNRPLGVALAHSLGHRNIVLMRGHGSTTVGKSVRQAVYRAVYAEVNARLQSEAMRLGAVNFLNEAEATAAAATNDAQLNRAWDLWARSVNP